MEPAAAGVLYAAENLLSGAAAIVKGITHPTLPLKANLTHITSTPVPRSGHSLSVVKGRAYIFGGESAPGVLADNDMQIVILPSSGVLEADYTTINARPEKAEGAVPAPRKGHSSVVIGDSIYIFGGEGVENENGRVWAFHTVRNTWSFLDPASSTLFPSHRAGHSSASSEYPGPKDITFQEKAPQQPADPAKVVPEPADPDTWGTIFVVGGRNPQSGEVLNDALAFDVKSRTWSNIPSPSSAAKVGVSMTLVENRLYTFGGRAGEKEGEMTATAATQYLDVSPVWKHAEGGTTPLTSGWAWEDLSRSGTATASADKHSSAPQPRSGAGLTGVTTGQGRHYVVLIGGSSPAPDSNTTILDDIWAFQLPSEKTSAAAAKDSARTGAKRETYEGHWAEVKYQYVDAKGEIEQERESAMTGVGARNGFAVAKGTEVDGASVVVWGGVGVDGNVLGDGWLVTVER